MQTKFLKCQKKFLKKPNDKHYEKLLKEVETQIAHHKKKSIEEYKEKIKAERYGNSPEIKKLQEEKEELKKRRDPLNKEELEITTRIKGPSDEMRSLKTTKDSLGKEIDSFRIDNLNAEIKSIQERLGFASLSIGEEKKND